MIKKTTFVIVCISLYFCNLSWTQDSVYAKKIVQLLASPNFHGRGYVDNGLEISADFIEKEIGTIGLQPFFEGYRQQFLMPVNTFPGKVSLCLDTACLQPGTDFLADPASPGLSGSYQVIKIQKKVLKNPGKLKKKLVGAKDKFICIEHRETGTHNNTEKENVNGLVNMLQYDPRLENAGVIELTDSRLYWNTATFLAPRPSFLVKKGAINGCPDSVIIDVENRFISEYHGSNLAAFIIGEAAPDSFLVFTAHYDHLGQMGNACYFPGANDNAAGVALLLDLARYYTRNKPRYSTAFIAFAGEEAGLIGSKYFVENSPIDLKKIKFLINLDLVGNGDEGITVVNGSVHTSAFNKITEINGPAGYFPIVKPRGEACNSDHCPFHEAEVPCFFIYTMGGTNAYHDINDTYQSLRFNKYNALFNLLTAFVDSF
ncbi:MAG: M28 family peptidase [Bacteroidales bacterium]|nr:M28 family peptidase [Bacteroidales bacterium]